MNALSGLRHYRTARPVAGRFREAGDLTLDLVHQDARVDDKWVGLSPREFAILWRLAERPGEAVAQAALAADLSPVHFGCKTGSIAAHVVRLGARLAGVGLGSPVAAEPDGRYSLTASVGPRDPQMVQLPRLAPVWTARSR